MTAGLRLRLVMNGRNYRMTPVMRQVLAIIVDAEEALAGYSLCAATRYGPGSVYPALEKLVKAGCIYRETEVTVGSRFLYRLVFSPQWYRANGLLPDQDEM
jgi:Fe2+ or Zn2+ uptake regulation protein